MAEYAGVLEKIYEDSGNGAKGPYVRKSFKVAGAPKSFGGFVNNKNAAMYNSVVEGDMVRITTVMNGQYENLDKIERIKQEVKQAPASASVPEKAAMPGTQVPYTAPEVKTAVTEALDRGEVRDFRITYAASRRDAIDLVSALVANGALSLGTKAADKADNFYKAVQRYALALAHDAWNVRSSDAKSLDTEAKKEAGTQASQQKYEE